MANFQSIINEIKKVINGKDRAVTLIFLALIANGNILIEDIPGVGKTTLAVAFSKVLGLNYKRLQFTPDTLPSDITGFSVYNKETQKLSFVKGAIFCNIFLADELNRTSSRTQSALLEAMEEHQVTVDGKTFKLENPFSVIATQNPIGASGTQLLPDSQTDRFMLKISLGYPEPNDECKILLNRTSENPMDKLNCLITKEELIEIQKSVKEVYVKKEMAEYVVKLIGATRDNPLISRGASPRASLSLLEISRANALFKGRDYIVPSDVQNVFLPTISHRITLNSEAITRKLTAEQILTDILKKVTPPKI